jgi:uncharacterized protein YndB with AHSA1/START domain
MLHVSASVCIDALAPQVWAALSDLESITLWVPAIKHAHCPAARRGVGAERVCELSAGTVHETILEWDEGHAFTYRGEGAPLMKWATNRWSVRPHGAQALVTSEARVELKGGAFGRALEPLVRMAVIKAGNSSLARLKYWIENGHSYAGRASGLPTPSPVC